ncbi:Thymus-specific serine protease [Ascosphaera atra]|nr:Thymus-specific serine protease [Ascosphaera atra]
MAHFLTPHPTTTSGDTPPDHKTIVSRALTADYFSNQCALFFPNRTYGAANNATATATNRKYGGWDIVDTPRLVWTNGQYDPWRDAGVSSKSRPAGPLNSTSQHPVNVIPKGVHALDYLMVDAEANQGVMDVVQREVKQIKEWVEEYYQPEHNKHSPPKPGWAWW